MRVTLNKMKDTCQFDNKAKKEGEEEEKEVDADEHEDDDEEHEEHQSVEGARTRAGLAGDKEEDENVEEE